MTQIKSSHPRPILGKAAVWCGTHGEWSKKGQKWAKKGQKKVKKLPVWLVSVGAPVLSCWILIVDYKLVCIFSGSLQEWHHLHRIKKIWPIFYMPCSNYLNHISCSGKQQKRTFVTRALSVADTPERTDFTNVAILKYLPSSSWITIVSFQNILGKTYFTCALYITFIT